MSYTTGKMRRAYFALCKGQGMSEEDRHAWNAAFVGIESTRGWDRQNWKDAVSELQRMAGQGAKPGKPRLRSERGRQVAEEAGDWATWEQCELIEALCDGIGWWGGREKGPVEYVCAHFLAGPADELRRVLLTGHSGTARWRKLTRGEASGLIQALRRMKRYYPAQPEATVAHTKTQPGAAVPQTINMGAEHDGTG